MLACLVFLKLVLMLALVNAVIIVVVDVCVLVVEGVVVVVVVNGGVGLVDFIFAIFVCCHCSWRCC